MKRLLSPIGAKMAHACEAEALPRGKGRGYSVVPITP